MAPARLAHIDRIRADEAARDVVGYLDALLNRGYWTDAPMTGPRWERFVWLWQAAVLGRDPMDTGPLSAGELTLLRLELL